MTDVFRSEILAVVMQQIMDEPVLPVLFLRTVCLRPNVVDGYSLIRSLGNSSRDNVQISGRVCVDDITITTDHKENMD